MKKKGGGEEKIGNCEAFCAAVKTQKLKKQKIKEVISLVFKILEFHPLFFFVLGSLYY